MAKRNQKYLDVAMETLSFLKKYSELNDCSTDKRISLDGLKNHDYLLVRVYDDLKGDVYGIEVLIHDHYRTDFGKKEYTEDCFVGSLYVGVNKDKINVSRENDLLRNSDGKLLKVDETVNRILQAISDFEKYNYIKDKLDNDYLKIEKFRVYLKYIKQIETLTGLDYKEIDKLISESQKLIPIDRDEVFDEILTNIYGFEKNSPKYKVITYSLRHKDIDPFIYRNIDEGLVDNYIRNYLFESYSNGSIYYKTDNLTEV